MPLNVIPVVNCSDFECVRDKTGKLRRFLKKGDWIHVDVADGRFTFNKTWSKPRDWATLRLPFKLEAHLMVEEPETCAHDWLAAGAKRLIIHYETLSGPAMSKILDLAKKYRAHVMLAFNPETPIEIWSEYLEYFNEFQVLAVSPGPGGQKFLPLVLKKIRFLRRLVPSAKIEVDGGINPETARRAKAAGADIVASGAYIWRSRDERKAYEELVKI